MLLKEELRNTVISQRKELSIPDKAIEREKLREVEFDLPFAIVISGVRRCGKSTFLRQLIKKTKGFYYFNFEDPKVASFEVSDFQKLNEILREEYKDQDYYFLDEIQNVPGWELFVRSMLDKKKHFVITGSNASLLSKELGTRLTGRHLRHEIFPFSFREFLSLTKEKASINSFQKYLVKGGFPQYLIVGKSEILQELLNDIIVRDIAIRHKIRNIKTLREIAIYLITNVGKEFSYNSLRKTFNLGSTNTAISFVSFFAESYLLFTVPKFDYSLKKQLVNPKKVYSIDNGISNVNSASFSADNGKMLENLVFLNLRKKYKEIFYFQGKKECDFVVKQGTKITEAIQVCYKLDEDNKDREVQGLIEALEKFDLKEGVILTYNQQDNFIIKEKKINILPVFKWIME